MSSPQAPERRGDTSARGALAAVGGLVVLSAAAAAYEIAPASVTLTIIADLGVGEAGAGWLISVMYLVAVLASVPVGAALDRTDLTRAVTVAAVALLAAGAAGWATASAGNYSALVATRVLGGLSYVTIWNAGANLTSRSVPPERRATAVGAFTASAPAGFALGQFGGPLVAAAAGWPAVFPAFGGVAIVGLALFRAGRARQAGGPHDVAETPDPAAFLSAFRSRAVWLVCAMGFAAFSLYLFLNSWLPSYFGAELGLSLAESGVLAALFPAVGVLARTGGGALSDRLFGGRRRPVMALSFVAAAPVVVALAYARDVAVAVGLLVAAGTAVQLGIGLAFTYVREVVDEAVTTTAVSLLTAAGLLGAFAGPLAAGLLIQWTGGYRLAFLSAAGVAGLGFAVAAVAPEPG